MSHLNVLNELIEGLQREQERSREVLHMVPSENVLSPLARSAYSGTCLLYTSPSPRDRTRSRMPSSA